ncbi:hypothetical protein DFJ74DRAFT_676190 [Hyaloraphidium curvatum]|nr:hypothetical protein DFJ74DRAFT_676190 [Hyaloraphidium curvatum]
MGGNASADPPATGAVTNCWTHPPPSLARDRRRYASAPPAMSASGSPLQRASSTTTSSSGPKPPAPARFSSSLVLEPLNDASSAEVVLVDMMAPVLAERGSARGKAGSGHVDPISPADARLPGRSPDRDRETEAALASAYRCYAEASACGEGGAPPPGGPMLRCPGPPSTAVPAQPSFASSPSASHPALALPTAQLVPWDSIPTAPASAAEGLPREDRARSAHHAPASQSSRQRSMSSTVPRRPSERERESRKEARRSAAGRSCRLAGVRTSEAPDGPAAP